MEQPLEFVVHEESNKVCRLHKAIYGLNQPLWTWFGNFSDTVIKVGLHCCQSNHSIFSFTFKNKKIVLKVYIDDIILTSDNKKGTQELKEFIQSSFWTKDLGNLHYFLG